MKFKTVAKRLFEITSTIYLISAAIFIVVGAFYAMHAVNPPSHMVKGISIGYLIVLVSLTPMAIWIWVRECRASRLLRNLTYIILMLLATLAVCCYFDI